MRPYYQLHVNALAFVLLLATFKITLGFENCTLCWDGSIITYSHDYCQEISNDLLTVDRESIECEEGKLVHAATCGCPAAPPALDPCTLCWDGSTTYSYDWCQETSDSLLSIDRESLLCVENRLYTAAYCGCPAAPPTLDDPCTLCSDGSTTFTNPGGSDFCQDLSDSLLSIESDASLCEKERFYEATYCGCPAAPPVLNPCTLCSAGSTFANPADYCQDLSDSLLSIDRESLLCEEYSLNQAVTDVVYCGCRPAFGDLCTMCKGGDTMGKPQQDVVFTVGAGVIDELLVSIYGPDFVDSSKVTCEAAESALSRLLYQQDDSKCYWNQLLLGQACGCPDNSEIIILGWTQRWSGILSLSGSLLIIVSIITKARKVRWSPYNQIVLGISFFDSLSSTAYIIGTAFTPKELGLHGSIGNNATCGFQAFLFQIGIASVYYSLLLWIYFLLVVKYNWTERKFSKVAKWVHLGVVALGLIMAFAVIPFATPDWRWCYLESPSQAASWWPGIVFFIIPVSICIIAMTVITVIFVSYVQQVYRKTQAKTMKGKGKQKGSLASRTVWQSVWFLAVFYLVWPIQFAAFVIPTVPNNYPIYVLAAILGPLQGFLNALVVFCRDRKSIQRRVSQNTKKLLSGFITKFKGAGSSEVVGPELAGGGRESKQAVEYSVENETAVQPEIGVGKLDKLEEEEKTPEDAASNDEGDVSEEEDFDENDEGILEHAINAGLLNDDDRKNFRRSIARIQSTRSSRFVVD